MCYTIHKREKSFSIHKGGNHMSFSDKLSANLTNAGRTVSQSLKNFSDSNSLQREMNAQKRSIQQKIMEIGQLYYDKYKDDPGADFMEQIESISNSERRIREIQDEIQDVQSRKPDLVQVPVTQGSVKPSAMVCMQCGCTSSDITQIYCASCGQKLTPQYPTAAAAALAPAQTASDVRTKPVQPSLTKPAGIVLPEKSEQSPAPETPAPAGRFCTRCGAKADAESLFCAQCGNKLP